MMPIFSPFHFCQQVRQMFRHRPGARSLSDRLAHDVEFTSPLTLDMANGEVQSLEKLKNGRYQLEVTTPAMTGASGALPFYFTEWLSERYFRFGERGAKAFLDLFNHRLCSLYYIAWQKNRCYVEAELDTTPALGKVLASLAFLPTASCFPAVHMAGLFTTPVRSQIILEGLLQITAQCAVQIAPFTGCWLTLVEEMQASLGNKNMTLGQSPLLGDKHWERAGHFTVILGPVDAGRVPEFSEEKPLINQLRQQITEYVGSVLQFSIELLVSATGHSPVCLGKGQLGYDIFLDGNSEKRYLRMYFPDKRQES